MNSATPKDDVESLMNEGLGLATTLLEKNGEFFPFAVVMHRLGEVVHLNAFDGREQPPSQEVRDLLLNELRKQALAGECKAIAVSKRARH